jgi:hypothetical protein
MNALHGLDGCSDDVIGTLEFCDRPLTAKK